VTSVWLIREDSGGHDGSPDVHAVCSSFDEAEQRIKRDYPKCRKVGTRLWRGTSGMWRVDVEVEEWRVDGERQPDPLPKITG
jgi:hypothetical protein